MAADPDCIFCKIIAGKIPSFKIAENDGAFAFFDINPLSVGHCLVIPKEHAQKTHQLSEATMGDVGKLLHKVAGALQVEDYNILQNNGKPAGQEVMHVHFHIIPKTGPEDGLGIRWSMLQEGSGKPSMDDIAKLTEDVKKRLA